MWFEGGEQSSLRICRYQGSGPLLRGGFDIFREGLRYIDDLYRHHENWFREKDLGRRKRFIGLYQI